MSSIIDSATSLAISTASPNQIGQDNGQRLYRARLNNHTAYFTAPNNAQDWWLHTIAQALLGIPLTDNAADLLTAPTQP